MKKILSIYCLIGFLLLIVIACKRKELLNPPTVTTLDASNITTVSSSTGGEVISNGGSNVTEKGICWSFSPNPQIADNVIPNGKEISKFSIEMTKLVMGTTYYVRAYAVNSNGVGYGNQISFTTASQIISKVVSKVGNISITMGTGTNATATVYDQFGDLIPNVSVNWKSGDSSIAAITSDGRISSEYDGEVYIKAIVGDKSDSIKLVVLPDYNNWKTFYKPVPNAFPDLNSYFRETSGSAFLTVLARLDLNKDGRTDLIFHLWHFRSSSDNLTMAKDAPVANRLVALVSQKDGSLKDQTTQIFGSSLVDLAGGASRKVRIADLNKDGYPDLVYALNREDNRPNTGETGANQSVAVISNPGGTYRTKVFGQNAYHHSVEILTNLDGSYNILLDNDEEYSFSNSSFTKTNTCPSRAIGTYLTFSKTINGASEYLFSDLMQSDYRLPNYLGLFKRAPGQNWILESTFMWPTFKQVDYVAYNGDLGTNNLFSYQGKEYVAGGFFESVALRLYPNTTPTPIVHFATSYLPSGSQGKSSINQNDCLNWSKLMAFESIDGKLQEINIISDPEGPYNINFMDAKDINKDGFDDLVTYPYIDGAKPRVYLNNQSGKLNLLNSNKFPAVSISGGYNSAFADIDGDGIEDLVFFPGNGCSCNNPCTTFMLYKGRKNLQ